MARASALVAGSAVAHISRLTSPASIDHVFDIQVIEGV
jgi:hypothetical protein